MRENRIEQLSKEIANLKQKLSVVESKKLSMIKQLRYEKNGIIMDYIHKYFRKVSSHCFYNESTKALVKFFIRFDKYRHILIVEKIGFLPGNKCSYHEKIFSMDDYHLLSSFQAYKANHIKGLKPVKKSLYCYKIPK